MAKLKSTQVYGNLDVTGNINGNSTSANKLATARTINGTSFDGSANITTTNWGTARNLQIGNTSKSVNGSANVSWNLSEIGALPATGGTISGSIKFSGGGYNNHAIRMEAGDDNGAFIGIGAGGLTVIGSGESTNAVRTALTDGADETMIVASDQSIRFLTGVQNGYGSAKEISINSAGVLNAPQGITGNASTATKLQTARSINGTNFDGSGNITTANWGTARTITIGNTGKSVNGSGNVTWSLSEIGAAASSHTHTSSQISDATNSNKANMIVKRDGSGNFSAGTISASLNGTASYANYMNSNTRMEYGWNGINYFNIDGTAGKAAKVNDTPTSAWWHIMRFNHANSSGFYTDLALPFNTTSMYYKRITNGSVQNGGWVKVLDSLNYNEYAPSKSGSGASGTWGISVSGNASTATKLQNARKLGAANFDGTGNVPVTSMLGLNSTKSSGSGFKNKFTKIASINVNGAWSTCSGKLFFTSGESDSINGILNFYFRSNGDNNATSIGLRWETLTNSSYADSIRAVKTSTGKYDLYYMPKGDYEILKFYAIASEIDKMTLYTNQNYENSITAAATSTLSAVSGSTTGNAGTATKLQTARSINGTNFDGTGNITTANWGTARTLTIGNTGKSVNGSGNVSWSLSEIGAAASSHTHNYAGSSSAGGNANAAVKLATARSINGTNFDGTGNITTANWGTARTITIGNTGKSVNGSGNVSWSLSEIGAAAASHSHSYLPLSGGTLSGNLTVTSTTTDVSGGLKIKGSATSGQIWTGTGGFVVQSLDGANLHLGAGNSNDLVFYSDKIKLAKHIETDKTIKNSLTCSHIDGFKGKSIISSTAGAGSHVAVTKTNSTNGYFTLIGYQDYAGVTYASKTKVNGGTNGFDHHVKLLDENGWSTFKGVKIDNSSEADLRLICGSRDTGLYLNTNNFGVHDWQNNTTIVRYNYSAKKLELNGDTVLVSGKRAVVMENYDYNYKIRGGSGLSGADGYITFSW